MSDPKIKVGADVGAVTAGIQTVGAAAVGANREAERSLAKARKELQGYVGDIEKARRAFEALQKSGARGTRGLRGKSFDDYVGGGWRDASVNDAEAARMHRDVLRRVGLTHQTMGGPGGQSALGFGGHSLYTAGRGVVNAAFPVGGVGGSIAHQGYRAAQASQGGLMSGGGLSRLAIGGGIGLAAFGAIKGIRSIAGKIGSAEDESSNYADLTRQVGAVSSEFAGLRDSVRQATAGMGLAYNEAAKLAVVYAHEAGMGPRQRAQLAGEVGGAAGFARGFGLDPEAGVRFFGSMRHNKVSGGDADNRKLAVMIGDAVADKGEFSRIGDLLDTVHGFVSTVASRSLSVANVGGFMGATSAFGRLGLPGLGLSESAGLAGRMDAGFRAPGGGEAGQNLMLSMLQRASPDATALDLPAVQAGGMFSRGADVFGRKSAQYLAAKALGDTKEMARLDRMSGAFGNQPFGEQLTGSLLGHYRGNTQSAIGAMGTFYGLGAPESAAAIAAFRGGGGGGRLSGALGKLGLDPSKVNPANLGMISALLNGDRSTLDAQAQDLLSRKGAGALTGPEAEKLRAAMQGDTEGLRSSVVGLSAVRGGKSEGDATRESIASLGNVFQTFAAQAVPLLTSIRDAAVRVGEKFGAFAPGTLDKMRSADASTSLQTRLSLASTPTEKYRLLGDELKSAQASGMPSSYIESVAAQIRGMSSEAPAGPGTGGGKRGWSSGSVVGGLVGRAGRKTKYDALFAAAAAKYGVPVDLLKTIAAKESDFNPDAVGRNANGTTDHGMMQHNSRYLADRGLTEDSARDPAAAIDAAAALLARNRSSTGSWAGATRAYNGSGPAAEAYGAEVYGAADSLARMNGRSLEAAAPASANGQTVTVMLQYPNGAPAAPPIPVYMNGDPMPAGARR